MKKTVVTNDYRGPDRRRMFPPEIMGFWWTNFGRGIVISAVILSSLLGAVWIVYGG